MKALPCLSACQRRTFWTMFAALTLITTALHTLALLTAMDTIGYFQSSAASATLFYACIGLGILVCAAFLLTPNENIARETQALPLPRFVGAAMAAAAAGATAAFLISRSTALPTPALLNLITAISLICAAAYFALRLKASRTDTTVLCGYGAILAATLSLISTYFDRYTQMNAPHKLFFHICMLAVMFALLLEQRDLLGRPLPRLCVASTALAAFLCTAFSLPAIIAFSAGVYNDPMYLFFDILALGFAVYFGTKCAHYALAPKKEVSQ